MNGMKYFRLGYDYIPEWFKSKVENGTVEILFKNGKLESCRFYNIYNNKEKIIHKGCNIYIDMLYK